MSKEKWDTIKRSTSFHVNIYRKGIVLLIGSLILNFALVVLIFYEYMHRPERDYYATNGETPPDKLTMLRAPNMSSEALLPPDPPTVVEQKTIPD